MIIELDTASVVKSDVNAAEQTKQSTKRTRRRSRPRIRRRGGTKFENCRRRRLAALITSRPSVTIFNWWQSPGKITRTIYVEKYRRRVRNGLARRVRRVLCAPEVSNIRNVKRETVPEGCMFGNTTLHHPSAEHVRQRFPACVVAVVVYTLNANHARSSITRRPSPVYTNRLGRLAHGDDNYRRYGRVIV